MKKALLLLLPVLFLSVCYAPTTECPECVVCEECPDPGPTMWAFYLENNATTTVRVWIDTDAYTVLVPDGVVRVWEERKLIDYVEEGSHYFYVRREADDGTYWHTTKYIDEDYTFIITE